MDSSKHFKMYKDGKRWAVAAVVAVSAVFGLATTSVRGNADATTNTNTNGSANVQTTQSNVSNATTTQSAVAISNSTDNKQANTAAAQSSATSTNPNSTNAQPTTSTTNANAVAVQPAAASTNTTLKNGVINENGGTYYYKNGQMQKNAFYQNDKGQMYYFGNDGNEYKNRFYQNWGHTYYFGYDGVRYTNQWYNNWGRSYYFGDGGVRANGTGFDGNHMAYQTINGNVYAFDRDGVMFKGFLKAWGHQYYFDNKTGARYTNKLYSNWGHQYYFDGKGVLVTNALVKLAGKTYRANAEGILTSNNAIDRAKQALGVPYVYGGTSMRGFDCSGLVQYAYNLGANYRTTYQQTHLGAHHYDVTNAPAGALVFFGSDNSPYHVGISLGNGSYIHAPAPGQVVTIQKMAYYRPTFYINM